MSEYIEPRRDFDWKRVTWGAPDAPVSETCSYCGQTIPEDHVLLLAFLHPLFAAHVVTHGDSNPLDQISLVQIDSLELLFRPRGHGLNRGQLLR